MSDAAAPALYTKFPWNDFTTGETAALIRMVEGKFRPSDIQSALGRFTRYQIDAKIERLADQGFLTLPWGGLT